MNFMQLVLGQIPEAIFFALFMLFAKNIKEKRVLFVALMIIEYILIKYTLRFSMYFHLVYMITTFLTLKVLYKEKSQITDLFILAISYIIIIATCFICFILFKHNIIAGVLVNRILIFVPLIILNYKINCIQEVYKKLWNRDDKNTYKIKSVTFRSVNIVIFNIIYFIINFGMVYSIYYNKL